MRADDQTRRAVAYLRWDEGDADTIAPSLYKGRGRAASSSDTAAAPDDAAPPGAAPAGTPAPAAPSAAPNGAPPLN
ncbi:hypothetical protein WME95_07775 [Sorangium sp. So ce327]|uniref:hypothetical protein n=1 Tax=Sorangium sp. So ce327 TaxID=3133301 RepID=UPI003F61D1F2